MKCVDTTYLVHLLRNDIDALKKAKELDLEDKIISTEINVYELYYGVYKTKRVNIDRRIAAINSLLNKLEILPLDHNAALRAAQIAGDLSKKGQPIGTNDCMIAGIMLTNGCNTIVTRDSNHFLRIKELNVESY